MVNFFLEIVEIKAMASRINDNILIFWYYPVNSSGWLI